MILSPGQNLVSLILAAGHRNNGLTGILVPAPLPKPALPTATKGPKTCVLCEKVGIILRDGVPYCGRHAREPMVSKLVESPKVLTGPIIEPPYELIEYPEVMVPNPCPARKPRPANAPGPGKRGRGPDLKPFGVRKVRQESNVRPAQQAPAAAPAKAVVPEREDAAPSRGPTVVGRGGSGNGAGTKCEAPLAANRRRDQHGARQ